MYRYSNLIIFLLLIFCIQSGFTQIKNQKIGAQSFSGDITVNATPERVWKALTSIKLETKQK